MIRDGERPALVFMLGVALGVFPACEFPERQGRQSRTVSEEYAQPQDSLDWRIFSENPQLTDSWHVSETPLLEIGAPEGPPETLFDNLYLTSAVRLSDGRVAVLDATGTNELRYFTDSGLHILTVAGTGEGPGEFRFPSGLIPQRGDTLAVFDWQRRRVAVFDGSGAFVSTTVIEDLMQPHVFARLEDGSFLANSNAGTRAVPDGQGLARDTGWVWRVDPSGQPVARVSPYEGLLLSPLGAVVPFSTLDVVGFWNGRVVHGDRDTYTFRTYELDGTLNHIISRRIALYRVTDRDLSDLRDRELRSARFRGSAAVDDVTLRHESPWKPDNHAAFGPMAVDRVGNLWVGDYDPRPDGLALRRPMGARPSSTWSVFGPEGRWITDVETPDGLFVTDIGDDYVLGVAPGQYGVPYVTMFALEK